MCFLRRCAKNVLKPKYNPLFALLEKNLHTSANMWPLSAEGKCRFSSMEEQCSLGEYTSFCH